MPQHNIDSRKLKKELLDNLFNTMGRVASSRYMPKKEAMPMEDTMEDEGGMEIEISASGKDAEDLKSRVEKLKKQVNDDEE